MQIKKDVVVALEQKAREILRMSKDKSTDPAIKLETVNQAMAFVRTVARILKGLV